jgi:hypothetical protein
MGFKTTGLDSICRGQSGENANISIMIAAKAVALNGDSDIIFPLIHKVKISLIFYTDK